MSNDPMPQTASSPINAIKQAEEVHREMQARLAIARVDLEAAIGRREGLALAAEMGDSSASREAGKLAASTAALADRIDHVLVPAVAQAAQRVAAARLEADNEAKRRAAERSREVMARAAERGAEIDAALAQAKAAYAGFQADIQELATIGAPAPAARLVDVNAKRALDAALAGFHSDMRVVPPLQRQSFDDLVRGWVRPTERWADQILGSPGAA